MDYLRKGAQAAQSAAKELRNQIKEVSPPLIRAQKSHTSSVTALEPTTLFNISAPPDSLPRCPCSAAQPNPTKSFRFLLNLQSIEEEMVGVEGSISLGFVCRRSMADVGGVWQSGRSERLPGSTRLLSRLNADPGAPPAGCGRKRPRSAGTAGRRTGTDRRRGVRHGDEALHGAQHLAEADRVEEPGDGDRDPHPEPGALLSPPLPSSGGVLPASTVKSRRFFWFAGVSGRHSGCGEQARR